MLPDIVLLEDAIVVDTTPIVMGPPQFRSQFSLSTGWKLLLIGSNDVNEAVGNMAQGFMIAVHCRQARPGAVAHREIPCPRRGRGEPNEKLGFAYHAVRRIDGVEGTANALVGPRAIVPRYICFLGRGPGRTLLGSAMAGEAVQRPHKTRWK